MGGDVNGRILVVEFVEQEEAIFRQAIEWLSTKPSTTPTLIKQQEVKFEIDPFTRTFVNDNRTVVYLTAKEFDQLYFLFYHKGQVFTKEYFMKIYGASII